MAIEDGFSIVDLRNCNSATVLFRESNNEGRYVNWGPVCSALLVRQIWKQSRGESRGMLINDRFYHGRALDWNFGFGKYALDRTHSVDDSADFLGYRGQLMAKHS